MGTRRSQRRAAALARARAGAEAGRRGTRHRARHAAPSPAPTILLGSREADVHPWPPPLPLLPSQSQTMRHAAVPAPEATTPRYGGAAGRRGQRVEQATAARQRVGRDRRLAPSPPDAQLASGTPIPRAAQSDRGPSSTDDITQLSLLFAAPKRPPTATARAKTRRRRRAARPDPRHRRVAHRLGDGDVIAGEIHEGRARRACRAVAPTASCSRRRCGQLLQWLLRARRGRKLGQDDLGTHPQRRARDRLLLNHAGDHRRARTAAMLVRSDDWEGTRWWRRRLRVARSTPTRRRSRRRRRRHPLSGEDFEDAANKTRQLTNRCWAMSLEGLQPLNRDERLEQSSRRSWSRPTATYVARRSRGHPRRRRRCTARMRDDRARELAPAGAQDREQLRRHARVPVIRSASWRLSTLPLGVRGKGAVREHCAGGGHHVRLEPAAAVLQQRTRGESRVSTQDDERGDRLAEVIVAHADHRKGPRSTPGPRASTLSRPRAARPSPRAS